jgi:hypothetical protein
MSKQFDREYLLARIAAERAAAEAAATDQARVVHLQLVNQYEELLAQAAPDQEPDA